MRRATGGSDLPTQEALPLGGITRCGYCDRSLVLQSDGRSWACPRCHPLLADVRTIDDYARFVRTAQSELQVTARRARA